MPFFIPVAIGIAVAGVAAAGAVGAAVKKRADKKKRQRESAGQKPVEQGQHRGRQPHYQPTQRPQRQQQPQTKERRQRPQPKESEQPSAQHPHDQTAQRQRERSQRPKTPERQPKTQPQAARKFPAYDRQALVKALDTAIATAAEGTLDAALAKPPFNHLSPREQTDKVRHKADAMRSALGGLRMPDYNDDITAAAYLLNYHPSHVGLAHAVVNQAVSSRDSGKMIVSDTRRLHVVDLASGTLAMQFGIAIAVADALVRGEVIREVVIDSVDINPAMLKAGKKVWKYFADAVQSNESLTALAEACRLIAFDTHTQQDKVPSREADCWLSCFHGVYQQNSDHLEHSLHALHDKHNPVVGLMTCWGKTLQDQNIAIAMGLAPFRGANWQTPPAYFLGKGTEYKIPFLFKNQEHDALQTVEVGHIRGILPPSWTVFWRPTDTAVLTYQREFPNYGH
jgi:hypothetical protein